MTQPDQLRAMRFSLISVKTLNDTQTNAEVVEIACARIVNLQLTETLHVLVNPGASLPEEFTRRTGLYSASLAGQPTLETVLPELASFVGHDFIIWVNPLQKANAVHRYFRLTQPRDKQLSLQTLAEKTLPDLSRHSLATLAETFNLETDGLARAENAVIISAKILLGLLDLLHRQHHIETMSELLNFCPAPKTAKYRTRRDLAFDRDKLKQYPTQPGVYFMKNRLGEILYIGKAKNLRNRLRSYFQKQSRLPPKIAAMMKQVTIIDVTVVGSELEALLLESKLIKEHQPFFNKKIKDYKRMIFMKVSMQETFPKITSSHEPDEPGAVYFGPFSGKSILRYKMEVLNRVFKLRDCNDKKFAEHRHSPCMQFHLGLCSGPCAGLIDSRQYRDSVEDFIRYLEHQPSNAIELLIAKREAYIEELKFEKAAVIQNQLDLLEQLQLKNYELLRAIEEHHCLIVLPATHPGAFRILSVIEGQPFQWHTFDPQLDSMSSLEPMIDTAINRMTFLEESDNRANIAKSLFEEARLISQWLENRTEEDGFVIYLRQKSRSQILNELLLITSPQPFLPMDANVIDSEDEAWEWEMSFDDQNPA